MKGRAPVAAVALTMLIAAVPHASRAQSLFAAGGLGVPVDAVDARTRGMGSLGVGLFGTTLTPFDPSAAYGIVPTLSLSFQPTWGEFERGTEVGELQGTRFPVLGLAYPIGRGQAQLTFGSYFDQRWSVTAQDTIELSGEAVPITDLFESDGGISTVRLGWAHLVASGLVVAANVGAYTGQVTRAFQRQFDTVSVDVDLDPFEATGRWRWSGPAAALAARWDPNQALRIAGSVNWSGSLEAQPQDSTEGPTFEFDLPLEWRVGGSAALTPEVSLSVGLYYADWSDAEIRPQPDSLQGSTSAGTVFSFGGGLEWSGPRLGSKNFPVRLGYRRQAYPFRFDGSDAPVETALAGGLGFNLAQAESIVLARMDLSLEYGNRSGGTLTERFWRGTLSFHASGF